MKKFMTNVPSVLALLFLVYLLVAFVMRALGEWAGDPLVPLGLIVLILIWSAVVAAQTQMNSSLVEMLKIFKFAFPLRKSGQRADLN